jgi:Iron dependent repressor, N-terminal DNA binding domain
LRRSTVAEPEECDVALVKASHSLCATGEELPYDVRLVTAVVDGRVVVTSLTVERREGGPPINGTGLRQIAVDRIVQQAFFSTVLSPSHDISEATEEAVAAIYQVAFALGYPPVKAVAERFGISPSTARGRIARARQAGLLSSTTKGKARS